MTIVVAGAADRGLPCSALPRSRRPSAGPASASWRRTPRRCRTTTRPIPACCGCSTARSCGTARPARRPRPAPIAISDARVQHEGRRGALSRLRQDSWRAPVDLEQRINLCRTRHQQATPLAYESRELLALTAFVAQQSRGMPIETGADPQLAPFIAKGRELFMQRQGQLNLACTNCHDDNWDKRLAGVRDHAGTSDRLSAVPAGMAIARLAAAPPARLHDAASAPSLMITARRNWSSWRLYLMSRARGMPIETPAVRP